MTFRLYKTLTREKEVFVPLHGNLVGLYVCGPTVYSDVHLGNCRTFISFDILYRYLLFLGYKVRYVRNITDAGHLEGDRDEGDDKFSKKARLEQLEPMEIVQRYTLGFHNVMSQFNTLPPSIEPTATGHILEQIEMTKRILEKGLAYEVNGTVYFDVERYAQSQEYGILTNRKLDDMLSNTRELGGQDEKRGRLDFALWIKAKPEHIMRWPSPWGEGFPGWHIECSAMSQKYLGETFDIHGGGMDLAATHHTNEIAQSQACHNTAPARFWVHTNMLTVNGQRMGKSLGNAFLPHELFEGSHPLLDKGYSPMTVRFFMLQTHYRSTLDFSNEALQASEKGFERLLNALRLLPHLQPQENGTAEVPPLRDACYAAMADDLNTPIALAQVFLGVKLINQIASGETSIDRVNLLMLSEWMSQTVFNLFGLQAEQESVTQDDTLAEGLMNLILELRKTAKERRDFATADTIRNHLSELGVQLKDTKEGTTWERSKS